MTITDFVITCVLVVIIGAAAGYIIKAKKSGARCVGCPYSKECSSNKESSKSTCTCGHGGKQTN